MMMTDLEKMTKMLTMLGIKYEVGKHFSKEGSSVNIDTAAVDLRIYTNHKKAFIEFNFDSETEKYLGEREIYIDDFIKGKLIKGDDVEIKRTEPEPEPEPKPNPNPPSSKELIGESTDEKKEETPFPNSFSYYKQ